MYSAEPAQTLQGGSSDLEAPLIPSKRPAQNPMSIEEFYKRESLGMLYTYVQTLHNVVFPVVVILGNACLQL